MKEFFIWAVAFMFFAIGVGISFLVFAGVTWVVCWAFTIDFLWRYAVGVWVIFIVLKRLLRNNITVKTKDPLDAYRKWGR